MAHTEWWQRGPIDGVPPILQPIAHILLQVRESVGEIVEPLRSRNGMALTQVASAAFHVRHCQRHRSRAFTYAQGTPVDRTIRGDSSAGRSFSPGRRDGAGRSRHGLTRPLRSSHDRCHDTEQLSRRRTGPASFDRHRLPRAWCRTRDASRRAAFGDRSYRSVWHA